MRILAVLLLMAALFVTSGVVFAESALQRAQRLYDEGRYSEAERLLKELVRKEPRKAEYRHLLGDVYKREGKLNRALAEYQKALELGRKDAELYKSMGTVSKWLKNYSAARAYYQKALKIRPNDREAKEDLEDLKLKRGVRLFAWMGGWEPDYTKESYELMLFYGGVDRLDLYGGYSWSDQIYYERDKIYAKGYYFYDPRSYIKLYVAKKDYDYPTDPALKKPNPDSNAYDEVPTIEVEGVYWFRSDLRGTLIYEFFRPTFFYDKDSTASNHKITGELYYLPPAHKHLKLKLVYAVLRDPDPDTTEIKGRDNPNTALGVATKTSVDYRTTSLLGGVVEYERDRWSAELKLIPNRDLDNSYSYSILANLGYRFTDRLRGRLDYVFDKYSSDSSYAHQEANVYMASCFYKLDRATDVGVGLKHIDIPARTENTGFLYLSWRTGIGF